MAIYLIGKIKQKNNGKFALVDAADIELPDGRRLDEVVFATKLSELENDCEFMTEEGAKTYINELIESALEGEY